MTYAYVKTVYAGTNVINIPFSYLSKDDVHLSVNGISRPQSEITWTSAYVVTITTAGLTAGDVILLARLTNIESMNVVYSNSTQLTKDNLNNANTQLLYNNQETRDYTALVSEDIVVSAEASAASAAASAASAEDNVDNMSTALTSALEVLEDYDTAFTGYVASASGSASSASGSASAASISAINAGVSEGNAEDYKDAAAVSAGIADTKADEAAASAAAALVSEGNASDSEDAAAISETNAGVSEYNAGVSESNAAQSAIDAAASAASVDLPGIFTYIKTVDGTGSGLDADLLDGNDSTAFATSGHTHTVYQNKIPAGICATAIGTAAKVVTIADYTPAVGDVIAITFTSGNSASAMTLNINSIGAHAIRMNNIATTTAFSTLAAGAVILLYWDGTYFQMLGSQDTVDADTTDRMLWSNAVTAGITLYSYKMMMQGANGKFYPLTLETGTGTTKTVSTVEFNIESPVLYYNSTTTVATNASTSTTVVYSAYPITNLTYTFNQATWTAQLPIYLKGTITAAGRFKLDNTSYTSWATQTLPTTEDGFVYMLLGHAYSTTAMRLFESHPLVEYKGSKLRTYIADGIASGLNADKLDGYHIDDILTYVAGEFAPASHVSDTAAPHGAVSTNTASKIVTRDASGNFSAGTISANLTGTATSSTYATQLLNSRTINISGDVTGTAQNFNGTSNITIPATFTKARAGAHAFRRVGKSDGSDNITITAYIGSVTPSFSVLSYSIGSGSAAALFTAPVTGLYHFDVCLRFFATTNAASGLACGLQTPTNIFYGTCTVPDGTLAEDLFTCHASIDEYLTTAQTVSISALKLGAGSCVVDVGASWWSGHLVYSA